MKLGIASLVAWFGYGLVYYGYEYAIKDVPLTLGEALFPWKLSDLSKALAIAKKAGNTTDASSGSSENLYQQITGDLGIPKSITGLLGQ